MFIANPAYPEVTEAWLEPSFWGEHGQKVSAGGRGSAWFVKTGSGEMVLRCYRRGGLAARFSNKRYIFTGWRRTRAYREFQITQYLYDHGLPVPQPVAASADQHWLSYEARILTRRIPGARPLPEVQNSGDDVLWSEVGRAVRRFHDAGLDHVDLNCDNILVAEKTVYLIDFDRCRLRAAHCAPAKWRHRNLERLKRSMMQRCGDGSYTSVAGFWEALLAGYTQQ